MRVRLGRALSMSGAIHVLRGPFVFSLKWVQVRPVGLNYFGLMIPQAQIRNDTIGSIQSLVHWVVGPRVRFLLGATGPVVRTFSPIFQNLPELNWLGWLAELAGGMSRANSDRVFVQLTELLRSVTLWASQDSEQLRYVWLLGAIKTSTYFKAGLLDL